VLIVSAIKAVVGWFVLMLISTNLVGLVVRGLVPNKAMDDLEKEAQPVIQDAIDTPRGSNKFLTLLFVVVTLIFLYTLYYFLNLGVVAATLMLMIARAPDLLWEINTGTRITKVNTPKGVVYTVGSILHWGALLVMWLSVR